MSHTMLDHCEPYGHAYAKIVGVDSGCPHCLAIGRDALRAEIQSERTANAELLRDKARLDWLDENMGYTGGGNGGYYSFFSPADLECGMLRAAIDAAMPTAPLPAPAGENKGAQ